MAWNEAADEYLVVWDDGRNDSTRGSDIYGRRVAADGTRLGPDFRISGNRALDDEVPAVAWNAKANQYLVVWRDARNRSTRGFDTFGRRISAAGAPVGADFRISGVAATANESQPAVAWNAKANQYLVDWDDGRNLGTRLADIYGRRMSATGLPIGADFRKSGAGAIAHDWEAAAAWNANVNRYLVVWNDWRGGPTRGSDI